MANKPCTMESLGINLEYAYNGKKVFVTGHTGFKGAWLITWLNQLGAIVKGYALAPENDFDLYHIIEGDNLCESIIDDIRNKERVKQEILAFEPDFIFHLAAQPLVRLSYQLPTETFDTNAQGTANILDALRFYSKPCIAVFITTDKVYHNLEADYYYKEDDRLGGYDPYSASKACAELIIDSFRNSFFHPGKYNEHRKSVSVARAGNVIGGGDWAKDRIVPDIIRALKKERPVIIRNPLSIRPWQHVLEPLFGYLILGVHQAKQPREFAEAFNFGPYKEDTFTVEELVIEAIKYWGKGEYQILHSSQSVHEAGLLKLDITKALTKTMWKPRLSARQAIKSTIEWYRTCDKDPALALSITIDSIKSFVEKE